MVKLKCWKHLKYKDHHPHSIKDVKKIIEVWERLSLPKKFVLTTEKDAVRLQEYKEELNDISICYYR